MCQMTPQVLLNSSLCKTLYISVYHYNTQCAASVQYLGLSIIGAGGAWSAKGTSATLYPGQLLEARSNIHCESKKHATRYLFTIFTNLGRFSKFCQCRILHEM